MFGEILSWILPLVFFIIWIFIMRRMGGGAGGGGGQNLQYRKIKAKLINKEDVAVNL